MSYYKRTGECRKLFAASVRAEWFSRSHARGEDTGSGKIVEQAYRRAHYHVFAPTPFVLRVGEPSTELDSLLDSHAANTWAFVTACNPGSLPLPPEVNARRMRRLRDALTGFSTYPGEGRDPAGLWTEESVLVVGIDREQAVEVAKEFEQMAILAGELGGAAELVWLR